MSEFQACRLNLEVTDIGPLSAFLRDVLEFEVDVEEKDMGLVLMHRGAVSLAVVRTDNPAVAATTAGYVTVADADALHDRWVERGARIAMGLESHPWGLRDFVLELPGGHRLAFGAPLGDTHS